MVFVFDIDDTICDTDGYSEKYILEFFKKNNLPYKQIATDVRFAEKKFDWDTETALNWYRTFGDDMMSKFPVKESAIETINYLHKLGHKIIIATARSNDWHCEPEKITLDWLNKNKIEYDKIYIGRIDKENICEIENADVFVDDDLKMTSKVAEKFNSEKGKYVFIPTTNYNKTLEIPQNIIKIDSIDKILNILNID